MQNVAGTESLVQFEIYYIDQTVDSFPTGGLEQIPLILQHKVQWKRHGEIG